MFANAMKVAGTVATVATLGIATTSSQAQLSGSIAVDGSSTVFPITQKMADLFTTGGNDGVEISVGVSGTGGGFRKFCAGETDISNASRGIKDTEAEACAAAGIEYIEVLVGTDALTVVVDSANTFVEDISVEELNKIWAPEAEGEITRWNQVDSSWPNQPMRLYGPGTDSGTFDFFTDEINGEEGASRADYTASENDELLVRGVAGDRFAMGYFGLAYYLQNEGQLRALAIGGVEPTAENAKNKSYPLARPLYIYISKAALEDPAVQAFAEFYINTAMANNGQAITDIGYVPLTTEAYETSLALIQ
ncbi:MAG: PstS family phosphate ABC transporter substrate-binding protein [Cyanobacteria bacterium P01_H01_bin.58]